MVGDLLVKKSSHRVPRKSITLGILNVDLGTGEAEFWPLESAGVRLPSYIYLEDNIRTRKV
jgi:hypothetical protein